MDPLLEKCKHCGFMPNTVAHRERSEPLERRIAELEAELVETRKRADYATARGGAPVRELFARAEKAEARWDSCKRMLEDRNAQLDKAEAEVERLKLFLSENGFLKTTIEDVAKGVNP